jgi:putative endonuclease
MDRRRIVGADAEQRAARVLEAAGLRVVERNVRFRGGEIDLVCRDDDVWVFVEVKARRPGWDAGAAAAVSWHKQRRLVMLSQLYLKSHGLRDVRVRFDVVEITLDVREPALRHLRGAFDAPSG